VKQKNAYELAKLIASSSGITKDLFEDKTPEGINRYENIEELLNAIKEFSEKGKEIVPGQAEEAGENSIRTLDEFIQDIALITDADVEDKDETDQVSLMTIHAAKGLEFPYVFIVGLEENLFPSIHSLNSRADLEEERRLFYVALTRAEKKVTISYAENRYRWGNITICEPSRFIDEIDFKYIESPFKIADSNIIPDTVSQVQHRPFAKKKLKKLDKLQKVSSAGNIEFDSLAIDKVQVGIRVEHSRFGKGKVISVEGAGANKKAAIFFHAVGQKQLLLKYAKLKIVD